jgi:putative DNA primase/helicase
MAGQDYRELLTEKLIEQLEAGTAPWLKPWDPSVSNSQLPYNPTSGKPYKGANSLYLTAIGLGKGYSDPRWATYKQADAQGWQVRKGEKGALVEYWKFHDEVPVLDGQGKPVLDENGKEKKELIKLDRPTVFRAVVFNAQQMDNVPELSKEPRKYDWDPLDRAEQILSSSEAKILHDQADRAFYSPARDEIHLPDRGQFPNQTAYYSTAMHELGHWTGHESRLGRDLSGGFGSVDYAKEELRAELSSYFMADRIGVPHDPGQHAAYVKSWIKVLKEDKNEIFRAARDAEQITEYVLKLDREREVGKAQELGTGASPGLQAVDQAKERTALVVPFAEKDQAKSLGAKWDKEAKAWYAPQGTDLGPLAKWIPGDAAPALAEPSPELTRPQREALMAFREGTGPEWKDKLSSAWMSGKYTGVDSNQAALLQQVRNTLGPEWLANLKDKDLYITPDRQPEVAKATERTWLAVPFPEKDQARAAGAKWDKEAKAWYAPEGAELAKVDRWIPKAAPELAAGASLDPKAEFAKAIKAAGLVLDGEPVMDGKMQRVPIEDGRSGNRDGAYVGYLDGKPSGHIQNHKTGLKENWTLAGQQLSPEQNAQLAAQAQLAKQQRSAELAEQHSKTAVLAQAKWDRLPEVSANGENAYLARKGVEAHGVKFDGERLVVPVRDVDGKLWSVQSISPEEGAPKMFEKGGRKTGNMHVIGEVKPGAEILVAEGYATGASLHQATGKTVAVAFDSGNLDPVVSKLKERYPTNPIFIAGDNDKHQEQNVGFEKAMAAAQKHQVGVAFPNFSTEGKLTDFNDLHQREGSAVVKAQIESALGQSMEQSRVAATQLAKMQLGEGVEVASAGLNSRHTGEVLGVGGYHAAQSVGGNAAVVHEVKNLDKLPLPGKVATIQYQDGRGQVVAKPLAQEKQLER